MRWFRVLLDYFSPWSLFLLIYHLLFDLFV